MLKKIAIVLATLAATPAWAGGPPIAAMLATTGWAHWHRYPDYAACVPYGLPIIPYARTIDYVPGIGGVPVRVYYIPREQPLYNVPPYRVIAPY